MSFRFEKFTEKEAAAVCGWFYEPPYEGYNLPSWEQVKCSSMGIADPDKRKKEFFSVYEDELLAGFIRLIKKEDCIMIGLGLKPELCGKGRGKELLSCIILQAEQMGGDMSIRLEVRSENQRAVRCYQKAGFKKLEQYEMKSPSGIHTYDLMEYRKSSHTDEKRESRKGSLL